MHEICWRVARDRNVLPLRGWSLTAVGVVLEDRFARTPDNRVWSELYDRHFWARYLAVFDRVVVCGRMREIDIIDSSLRQASGDGIEFIGITDFSGAAGLIRSRREVDAGVAKLIDEADGIILRTPGMLALRMQRMLGKRNLPFAVEVVGDPWDVFSPRAFRHWSRPLARLLLTRAQKRLCREAVAAAYVTEHALQRRYPPGPRAYTTHYSSIRLARTDLRKEPRAFSFVPSPATLGITASLAHHQKGLDVLLEALSRLRACGVRPRLRVIGGGAQEPFFRRLAADLGVDDQVEFMGVLGTAAEVLAALDEIDLFVLPTRQEGLPRTLIEAMARGLPAIATPVGGIPELLDADDLFPVDDAAALATKIATVLESPELLSSMAARNLATAARYTEDVLAVRRREFYRRVKLAFDEGKG